MADNEGTLEPIYGSRSFKKRAVPFINMLEIINRVPIELQKTGMTWSDGRHECDTLFEMFVEERSNQIPVFHGCQIKNDYKSVLTPTLNNAAFVSGGYNSRREDSNLIDC